MNFKEIIAKLQELEIETDEFEYQGDDFDNEKLELLKKEVGEIEFTEHFGGEGDGDQYWEVVYFKDQNVYIHIPGWYQSYDGGELYSWDSVKEVKPIEKTIIVYE